MWLTTLYKLVAVHIKYQHSVDTLNDDAFSLDLLTAFKANISHVDT